MTRSSNWKMLKHRAGHAVLVGYARVSTREQTLDSQLDELRAAGCARIYAETCSSLGARPGWAALLESLRQNDTVVVVRLDRIGRKLAEVIACVDAVTADGCHVRALAQRIDTRAPGGRQLLPIWAALAETERELIVERTRAGLDAARARGATFGRPSVLTAAKVELVAHLRSQGHALRKIAEATGLGEGTVRKALAQRDDTQRDARQLRLVE